MQSIFDPLSKVVAEVQKSWFFNNDSPGKFHRSLLHRWYLHSEGLCQPSLHFPRRKSIWVSVEKLTVLLIGFSLTEYNLISSIIHNLCDLAMWKEARQNQNRRRESPWSITHRIRISYVLTYTNGSFAEMRWALDVCWITVIQILLFCLGFLDRNDNKLFFTSLMMSFAAFLFIC